MVRKGFTQKELAQHLGISEKTFCSRIKNKRFETDEIERLIPLLEINNPMQIFFDSNIAYKVAESADQKGE